MAVKFIKLKEEHLETVMKWRMDPRITKYMNTDPVLTIEKQKIWYDKIKKDDKQIHWIVEKDNELIGYISLFNIDILNSRCSWGYYIGEFEKRSLKLALNLEWNLYEFVFSELKMKKLCNETFLLNKEVIKLHEICGSVSEGVMRQHIYKKGIYYDVYIGSILDCEWQEKKKTFEFEKYEIEFEK